MEDEQKVVQTAVAVVKPQPLRELLSGLKDLGPEAVQSYVREIVERELAIASFDQMWRVARVFAESGYFADAQAVTQAMAKIQMGESWNMSPADAMQHIFFVNGKPAVQNEYLGRRMRDSGLKWEIEWHRDEQRQCIGCTLWPSQLQADKSWVPITERENGKIVNASVSFMKADAERAGLLKTKTYVNYIDDMLYWRCIARLARRYATNVLSGVPVREDDDSNGTLTPSPATHTHSTTEALAERIQRERATTTALPIIDVPPDVPWTDRNSLNSVWKLQRGRIGDKKCDAIFAAHGVHIASLRPDDPKAALVYADMLAEPTL